MMRRWEGTQMTQILRMVTGKGEFEKMWRYDD